MATIGVEGVGFTHGTVQPLLVALHAVTGIDHDKLASIVKATLVTTDLSRLTQHPVLKIHNYPRHRDPYTIQDMELLQ